MKCLRSLFFVFCTLLWALNVMGQTLPSKGVDKWHQLPFADVRLLSCVSGTLDRSLLVGGLQVKVHPGWILKKPNLKPLSDYAIMDYPIRPDPVDTTHYTGTILLPIVYNVKAEGELHFGVQGTLEGCWDEHCLELPIRIEIPLDDSESDYTAYCAYIMNEIAQTPKLDFQVGSGVYKDDHTAILRFHVPDIQQAFLQNQNGLHFKVLQTQFWQNDVQFIVSYPETWKLNTAQDWILISNQGVFRVPILLTNQPLPPIIYPKPWGLFLLMGILMFICSPFFILWGTAFPKTAKQLRHQCVWAMIVSAVLVVVQCLWMKYFPELNFEKFKTCILVIMAGTLIFTPRFVWWAGLLFIIWPKPYLSGMVNDFNLWYFVPWLILWQLIPFAILWRYAEFWGKKARASLKKGFFSHNLFFLLPTILMLIYGIYQVRLNVPYQYTFDTKGPKLVCAKEDCAIWIEKKINPNFIDANSSLGKILLDLYQAQNNLLMFEDFENQTILTDTTPEKLKRYWIGLQSYRAGYRPADPPVHSGDDPRDPLPNAK